MSILNESEIRAWPAALFLCVLLFVAAFGAYSGTAQAPSATPQIHAKEASQNSPDVGWTTLLTGAQVIVGAIQLVLFVWQLRLLREDVRGTRSATEIAKTGADAARENADTSKLSMIAGQRAYVHYNGCRWFSHRDTSTREIFWRLRPSLINRGNTPTRRAKVFVKYELLDQPLPDNFSFDRASSEIPGSATLSPQGIVELGYFDFKSADLIAVAERKKHLYLWGEAVYRDVFPGSPERVTKFCVFLAGVAGDVTKPYDGESNPVELYFPHDVRHNCVDDDCDQQPPPASPSEVLLA